MKQLVRNGIEKHPGANYVQQKGSAFKKYLAYGNRDKVAQDLKCGDIVERHVSIKQMFALRAKLLFLHDHRNISMSPDDRR